MISIDLSGKVALVTGGKTGIGEGIVALLLESGASVVSGDLGYEKEFEHVSEKLAVAQLDVADEASVDRWINNSLEHFSAVDILVNCAGTSTMDYVVDSLFPTGRK